jgi:hypothetical protein
VSITEDAPATAPVTPASAEPGNGAARRTSAWWWLVAASALALLGVAAVLGLWWWASGADRVATYRVVGQLAGIRLDLADADVTIEGGGTAAVEIRRTDSYAFDRPPLERRAVREGVLRISSRCPETLLGTCRAAYRLSVPDNVPIDIRTTSGSVRIDGLRASATVATRSGPVVVDSFCGFLLRAVSESGDLGASADCSTERTELRSNRGDVRLSVPPNRYRIDAQADGGRRQVRGVTLAEDAPFAIQALSTRGDVTVEGRP